ncbi:tripartite tricarboxylate transporter substrate binding protein [Chelativorans sp. Marseille-P2723]|uniref:Bug family tripartite tricarboxylate transporter substrate binding protein n=1 Tax=Chelativorans sp. Marseille-P2723 TaxID=2709133 RepID=UPI00156FCE02|nr:tripartite tricarboxylate transporter substrate binding protein [Chelativorans sp. Marseille-P2723]
MISRLLKQVMGAGAVAGMLCTLAVPVAAQEYPTKPVRAIVPFAAGGGTDIFARIWGEGMGKATGQRFLIENMPGAAGAIGTKAAIGAEPDGYTVVAGTASTIAINPHVLGDEIGYSPLTELKPVALFAYTPWIMVASAQLGIDSVEELIAYGKENPGELTWGGWTSTGEIARKIFTLRTGVDIQPVPYDGAVAALNDLVAGRTSVATLDYTSARPFIDSGNVKALAVTGPNRTELLPGLPSFADAGVHDVDINSWVGLFAPADTPDDIVARLNEETNKVFDNPEVRARLAELGADVYTWSPKEWKEFVVTQSEIWARTIEEVNSVD